jgi:eukaryotic-like serine/threonine-protein kinase
MKQDRLWSRWEEVDGLLEQILDLPAEEREATLVAACGRDRELLSLLRQLVRDSELPESAGAGPPTALLRAALTDPAAAEPHGAGAGGLEGEAVGAYRLMRVLGVGGMGTVYLAERADGVFERQVAVKVLHRRLEPGDVAARFRQERRILASLQHDGIAQLIDGGVTPDGWSYIVMEYVDGVRIDDYARVHQLDVDDRIRLLVQAAAAVEYAHRQMVVHRDLKPSNIIVTEAGRVKLLDFGIAKLLQPLDGEEQDSRTDTLQRFATPQYAAPEQLIGERVSAQTDVYGLSVVLYELLTGQLPYGQRGAESVLERVIRGAEPTAPSLAVVGDAAESAAPRTRAVQRRLAGDIDAIVLKGLRARPEERYASVAALREDIERHLAGLPVLARGDVRMYRMRRFIGRHRAPLALAAGAFLLVTGSAAGLAIQRGALLDERDRASYAAEVAAREAETARRVTGMLVGLFEAADPLQRADTLTVHALLARGAERIDAELATEPEVRAELLDVLGRVHGSLGRYDEGVALLSRAIALRRDTLPDRAGLVPTLNRLGDLQRTARDFPAALEAYRAAFTEAERAGDVAGRAQARLGMAQSWVQQDATDSARIAFETGLELLDTSADSASPTLMSALTGLAGLRRRTDDLDGAAALYERVIDLRRRGSYEDPMSFAVSLNNLAVTRRMQGRHDAAATLYREALDTATIILGAGHPTALMMAGNLAHAYNEMQRADLALEVYRRRVDAARAQWPEGDWRLAEVLMNLGAQLVVMDRDREAIGPLRDAVEMLERELDPGHSWTAVYRGWLGSAAALAGAETLSARELDSSVGTLARYEGLRTDRLVMAMLEALVREIEQRGLDDVAARYRTLMGSPPAR